MNVLFLDQFSEFGGAQMCLLSLLERVRELGWDARVGLPGEGGLTYASRQLGFETFPIPCGPFTLGKKTAGDLARFASQLPLLAREIRRHASARTPDLIYVNGPRLLPATALAGIDAPALFHSHSYIERGFVRRLGGWAIERLRARVIACCRHVAEPWERYATPVEVIYNGVAGPRTAIRRRCAETVRVGCIGRISPEKGQLEFVGAARQIHRELPNARFSIWGTPTLSGRAGDYAARVRAAAFGLPIDFSGWAADVQSALEELDLLLVPSGRHEAATRVIPEAFAAGVPVIAFGVGGIPEIVEHGRTGFLCRTANEMASLAIDLLTGPAARLDAIAGAAREAWRQNFTLERWQDRMIEAMGQMRTQGAASAAAVSA